MAERQKNIHTHPHRYVRHLVQTGFIREMYALFPTNTVNEIIEFLEGLTPDEHAELIEKLMLMRMDIDKIRRENDQKISDQFEADWEAKQKVKGKK